ncbi:antibiotic synthesis protein MbtH [Micromonospora sp. NRRL B-16802]|uniref:MbtH family protein n=1 Tax=Micromonospora sp. NRRL B-16802 TaxID=1415541 RepID=UPI0006AE26D8|nr:MbtH family NRPS accessory protein [Micromonospora sp. NRRL B-16802]KOX07138.1 antibiotic synthesis protein MbtH [Micromonospora sp. NRRL B-16802]
MDAADDTDSRSYRVVVNDEEQFSIWPVDREGPAGWTGTGKTGSRAECLRHIGEVWTDLRPLSLRRRMEQDEAAEASR